MHCVSSLTLLMLWGSGSSSSGARFKFSVSRNSSVIGLAYSFNLEGLSEKLVIAKSRRGYVKWTLSHLIWTERNYHVYSDHFRVEVVQLQHYRVFDQGCGQKSIAVGTV